MVRDWKHTKNSNKRRRLELKNEGNCWKIDLIKYIESSRKTFSAEGYVILESTGEKTLILPKIGDGKKEFSLKQVVHRLTKMVKVDKIKIK